MMPLALTGVLLIAGIVAFGVYKMLNSFTLKQTTSRYRYVKTKDEGGNEITKVIDLEDKE